MIPPNERYSEQECAAEFRRLFPQGFAGPDVFAELAPNGWEASPLAMAFHPTLEQVFNEARRVHGNLDLLLTDDQRAGQPEPTLDEVRKNFRQTPIEPERECGEIIGKCLWHVFSDGHEVIGPDGRWIDIGSFRGAAGFIAETLNQRPDKPKYAAPRYDYLDFYMGAIWHPLHADLTDVYTLIFKRLQRQNLDWRYYFPKLQLLDLRPMRDTLETNEDSETTSEYSPEKGLELQRQEEKRECDLANMRESLAAARRVDIDNACIGPLPTTVLAYQRVYERFPQGWPPTVE